jgi:hypothetical protein
MWGFYDYFQDFVPGAGPQGGEAIVAGMFLMVLIFGGASVINGLLWLSTLRWRRAPKYLLGTPALMVAVVASQSLFFALCMAAGDKEESAAWRVLMTSLMVAWIAAFYGFNLYALGRFRRR